jgi:hypothetical protein
VTNLSHTPSFHLNERITPSIQPIKHHEMIRKSALFAHSRCGLHDRIQGKTAQQLDQTTVAVGPRRSI